MNLVTAYKAYTSIDAQMMASRLEAAGFHPFVADEYTAANMAGGAVGIRVQVPESEFAEVRTFIDSPAE
jgi:hypothetical protein